MAERWAPKDSFDWTTAGRVLSDEEMRILRRMLAEDRMQDKETDEDPLHQSS
jgi:uncharacterized membrane protein